MYCVCRWWPWWLMNLPVSRRIAAAASQLSYSGGNWCSAFSSRKSHQEYVDAGAEILETNTYGATHTRLKSFGLADQVEAINAAGVRWPNGPRRTAPLWRAPWAHWEFIWSRSGPFPRRRPAPFSASRPLLCEAGADLLILESFTDLHELREAVLAARDAAGEAMVIVAQVAIDDRAKLPGRTSVREVARALAALPVDVAGFNCCVGPKATLEALEEIAPLWSKLLSAMPNAGAQPGS